MSDPSNFGRRLTQDDLEDYFVEVISEDLTEWTETVPAEQQPELILLLGQPGAGAAAAHMQFVQDHIHEAGIAHLGEHPQGVLSLDVERLRTFHPDYYELSRRSPDALEAATEADVLWWQNRACQLAMDERHNVLLEREWDSVDAVTLTAERFAGAGYRVHVAALAVPSAMSRLALVESFVRQAEMSGHGRWVPPERHDKAFQLTAEALVRAESSAAVTRISVRSRDGAVHDQQRGPDGQWPRPGRVGAPIEALAETRTQVLTRSQRTALASRLASTMERMHRAAVVHMAVMEAANDLIHELAFGIQGPDADVNKVLNDLTATNDVLDRLDDLGPPTDPDPDAGPDIGRDPPEPDVPGPDI